MSLLLKFKKRLEIIKSDHIGIEINTLAMTVQSNSKIKSDHIGIEIVTNLQPICPDHELNQTILD